MTKQALGSIPTFDNVSKKGEPLDLFTEEKSSAEDDLKAKLKEEILKGKEDFKKKSKDKEITKQLKERKEQEKALEKMQEEIREQETNIASVKRDVRKGYIRQTFVVKEEYLEIIRAISFYHNIKQVNFLEALIEAGLKEIDDKVIEQAVKEYRKNNALAKTKAEELEIEQNKVNELFSK